MMLKAIALFMVVLLSSASAFSVSRLAALRRPSAADLRMMSDPPTPGEWTGAKKFSMKDRYTQTVFTNEQIAKILPHRYPFLLVDKVVEFEPGKRAVGIKCITANEPQFTGHFPDRPIMPGMVPTFPLQKLLF